jgi:hypothetical protein
VSRLASKRVLLLAPIGQHASGIAQAIVAHGGEVDLFEERPSLGFWGKVLVRYFPRLSRFFSQPYFNKILAATCGKMYDYVLIIRAEAVTRKVLLDLKRTHPNAKLILYQWDSMTLTRGPVDKLDLFDVLVSFDKKDCARHSMAFLPLFYLEEYRTVSGSRAPIEYDLSFIGTIHSNRYRFITQIRRLADARNLTTYFYLYLTSYAGFYKLKYFDRNLPGASRSEFRFAPLPKVLALDVVTRSRIVVDAEHPAQTGLTIRTFETLGAKKKLITTNTDVVTYDFYRPSNILVVDRNDVIIPDSFITQDYLDLDKETYEKYSVGGWVQNLFSLAEKDDCDGPLTKRELTKPGTRTSANLLQCGE